MKSICPLKTTTHWTHYTSSKRQAENQKQKNDKHKLKKESLVIRKSTQIFHLFNEMRQKVKKARKYKGTT